MHGERPEVPRPVGPDHVDELVLALVGLAELGHGSDGQQALSGKRDLERRVDEDLVGVDLVEVLFAECRGLVAEPVEAEHLHARGEGVEADGRAAVLALELAGVVDAAAPPLEAPAPADLVEGRVGGLAEVKALDLEAVAEKQADVGGVGHHGHPHGLASPVARRDPRGVPGRRRRGVLPARRAARRARGSGPPSPTALRCRLPRASRVSSPFPPIIRTCGPFFPPVTVTVSFPSSA